MLRGDAGDLATQVLASRYLPLRKRQEVQEVLPAEVTRDPDAVRCLIETAIDERVEHLGPLTPSPPVLSPGNRGREALSHEVSRYCLQTGR